MLLRRVVRLNGAALVSVVAIVAISISAAPVLAESAAPDAADWQVAGYVNLGEPTVRVVYDATFPDGQAAGWAARLLEMLQARVPGLHQPGVTDGLPEVAYWAHIGGVQLQLYSASSSITADDEVAADRPGLAPGCAGVCAAVALAAIRRLRKPVGLGQSLPSVVRSEAAP
jgi:hypothetical protein